MPFDVQQRFIDFCYPADLPGRQQQIDCDAEFYRDASTTLLVFNSSDAIVGCIQVVFGSSTQKIPVEYGKVAATDGSAGPLDIKALLHGGTVSEIYRCRRSFDLNRMEAIQVLMMLFKAVWAKTIQCKTAWSCISFDPDKTDLRHLYINKLSFIDPGVSITFGDDPKRWSLLIKDWSYHEHDYAGESTTHFYMQTWGRMGLKQMRLKLPGSPAAADTEAPTILFAKTRHAGKRRIPRKRVPKLQPNT
jgi:hypothetical protein